ncbi:hypothetical protein ABZ826_37540 [Streptomyces sp. NPDC047515]|uniref:hypothetical protein n=1 Tax=Streptomyces sp. NPDC047515 TaxID=3155380 RepID=UPI00340E5BF2
MITRTPEVLRWERGSVEVDVVVSGAVADLMLVFSQRVPPEGDRVTVTGDRALLDHWLANTALWWPESVIRRQWAAASDSRIGSVVLVRMTGFGSSPHESIQVRMSFSSAWTDSRTRVRAE